MKRISWQVKLGIALLAVSALLYGVHYLLFRDLHHIELYLLGDIAFVPIEVLLVTVIIHGLLTRHEKAQLRRKMNMVVSVFFGQVGTELMGRLAKFEGRREDGGGEDGSQARGSRGSRADVRDGGDIARRFAAVAKWSDRDFIDAAKRIKLYSPQVDLDRAELFELKIFMAERRDVILRLLENPNLLEHDSFTDMLLAVSHLADELSWRDDLGVLPRPDREHLSLDVSRAYVRLICEWLHYLRHLKADYPYLFSLAVRTNPFDASATPVVTAT